MWRDSPCLWWRFLSFKEILIVITLSQHRLRAHKLGTAFRWEDYFSVLFVVHNWTSTIFQWSLPGQASWPIAWWSTKTTQNIQVFAGFDAKPGVSLNSSLNGEHHILYLMPIWLWPGMQLNRPKSALISYTPPLLPSETPHSFSSQFKTMRFSYHISSGLPSPQPALRRIGECCILHTDVHTLLLSDGMRNSKVTFVILIWMCLPSLEPRHGASASTRNVCPCEVWACSIWQ